MLSLATYRVDNPSRFGVVVTDDDGLVRTFEEKPLHPVSDCVNTGIYVCDRRLLRLIPDGFCDFAKDVFPWLMGNVFAMQMSGFWSDIGTLPTYYWTNLQVVQKWQPTADGALV